MSFEANLGSNAEAQEIGTYAVWSVSSAKPGFGVERLLDNDFDTYDYFLVFDLAFFSRNRLVFVFNLIMRSYWQSDAVSPHFVNIQFNRRVTLCEVKKYIVQTNERTNEHCVSF